MTGQGDEGPDGYMYMGSGDGGWIDASFDSDGGTATPSSGWPSDFVTGGFPDSTERVTRTDLTSFVVPVRYLGTDVGTNPGDVRWDLTPGPGVLGTDINLTDLTALIAGTTGSPPMLDGSRAFGGSVCPWPE